MYSREEDYLTALVRVLVVALRKESMIAGGITGSEIAIAKLVPHEFIAAAKGSQGPEAILLKERPESLCDLLHSACKTGGFGRTEKLLHTCIQQGRLQSGL